MVHKSRAFLVVRRKSKLEHVFEQYLFRYVSLGKRMVFLNKKCLVVTLCWNAICWSQPWPICLNGNREMYRVLRHPKVFFFFFPTRWPIWSGNASWLERSLIPTVICIIFVADMFLFYTSSWWDAVWKLRFWRLLEKNEVGGFAQRIGFFLIIWIREEIRLWIWRWSVFLVHTAHGKLWELFCSFPYNTN